ncbi:hypothetical protein [Natronorarus salvus]|uniref:hypothetical protein n=1 Tax=Natronorarus salvus TaxID=3117733 RepID=UPI002F2685C9
MSQPERVELGTTRTTLSVAIGLEDAFTGRQPRGPRVRLGDRPETFTRTPSGYYVLTDLPEDAAPITVSVDGTPDYLPEQFTIESPDLDSPPVIETIELVPSPAYRFPANATLVRGSITEGTDASPLSDVTLKIEGTDDEGPDAPAFRARGRSDERGEYVLFITGITADDVIESYDDENGESDGRVVHVAEEKPTVRAVHPDTGQVIEESIAVPVGGTTRLDLAF